MTISKRQEINADTDEEKSEPLYFVAGIINWCTPYENSMEEPQKIKIELLCMIQQFHF